MVTSPVGKSGKTIVRKPDVIEVDRHGKVVYT